MGKDKFSFGRPKEERGRLYVWEWGVLTNNLLRKLPTSSVVDGPPIFINTMAVGPLDEVMSCVTGGTTVAIYRVCMV